MRIEVLGPLCVRSRSQIGIPRASHRRLLSILALEANAVIATGTLIDRFWRGTPPPSARTALQMHVSALRRILPARLIVTEAHGYRLDLARHELDLDELESCVASARRAALNRDWEEALSAAGGGLRLWRGDPFAELADDEFARIEIRRLDELRLSLLELKTEALLQLDRSAEALPDLEQLAAAHPLRERVWEQLMRARYRLGRHADALVAYRDAWAAFSEIGLEPSSTLRRLEQEILLHDEGLAANVRTNLPLEPTPFVGRVRELDELRGLLDEHRLVTLTGVGGAGKTRLALRAARNTLPAFPDGCWLAELAPVRDAGLVALELADAVGLRARGDDALSALTTALGDASVLVLLDNCEHVLDGAASVCRALLDKGPRVSVLATSREPLRVPGEVVYEVPPMPYPEDGNAHVEDFDAVRLFEERAGRSRAFFALDDSTREGVALICRRLDGIPLAIELAAARVGSLGVRAIAERLDDRFRLLTGGSPTGPARQQTLAATFDWSYELLDGSEQCLFARLSVFQGSFALDAAEEVCAGELVDADDVVPLVVALADKSLVTVVETETRTRYRLLETVRAYARSKLADDDARVVRSRHAAWSVRFARDVAIGVHGAGRWELFERLDAESDNLRAVLDDVLDAGDDGDIGSLALALAWNALDLGHLEQCIDHLRTALSKQLDPETEAASRSLLGTALFLSGRPEDAFAESSRAAALVAQLEPAASHVAATTAFARLHLLLLDRDPREAIPLSIRALDVARATDDPFARIYALRSLGRSLVWSGEADRGVEHYQAALDLALETGDRAMILETYESFFVLLYLHPVARRTEPRRVADEMLTLFSPDEPRWGRYTPADWLPTVFLQSGEWDNAEEAIGRLRGRHLEGWDRSGYLVYTSSLNWMRGRLDEARSALAELERLGVGDSWYHAYYPLVADIAADQRRLADVRATADAYLSTRAHRSEEAKKLAVLSPLARAEADAALVASRRDRAGHVRRCRAVVERGKRILDVSPPLVRGSLQLETPWTYLALAEAELGRATGTRPEAWESAAELADTVYFRLYARYRHVEALVAHGEQDRAAAELGAALAETVRVGAGRLQAELEALSPRTFPVPASGG